MALSIKTVSTITPSAMTTYVTKKNTTLEAECGTVVVPSAIYALSQLSPNVIMLIVVILIVVAPIGEEEPGGLYLKTFTIVFHALE